MTTSQFNDEIAGVPEDFKKALVEEKNRFEKETLNPRGLSKRKVMLVGGGGYIGIPVSLYFVSMGFDVLNIDMSVYGHQAASSGLLGRPGYTYKRVDFANGESVREHLDDVTDVIILGGLVGDPVSNKFPKEHQALNLDGLRNLFTALHGFDINRVVFVSTCSNYGEIPENKVANEDFALKPLSPYAKAKVAHEKFLMEEADFDYNWSIMRFSTAFGLSARMRFDLTVNQFTRALFLGEELDVYDADTWRPYCHTYDFGRAMTRVLTAPTDLVNRTVFNTGGDSLNNTKAMVLEAINEFLPDAKYKIVEGGFDRRNYRVDFSRIRDTLHFEPMYTVRQGVQEIIEALKQGYFTDFETNKNLYGNYDVQYAPSK